LPDDRNQNTETILLQFCRTWTIHVPGQQEVIEDDKHYPEICSNPEFQKLVQAYSISLAQNDLSPEDVDSWTHFTELIMDDNLKGQFD